MPAASFDEIAETFELLDDWEQRFSFLIDLGKSLPTLAPAEMTDATRVHGCQASVWMMVDLDATQAPPRLRLRARSDAHIVNGLIAILRALYDGLTPEQARSAQPEAAIARLGLADHLSPTRRNGLFSMVERVRALIAHTPAPDTPAPSAAQPTSAPPAASAPSQAVAPASLRIFDTARAARPRVAPTPTPEPDTLQGRIIDAIKTVYDPEMPVNLYDLGLIYSIRTHENISTREHHVEVDMTLTSPACPVAQELPEQVRRAVEALPGVARAEVRVVWEPRWTRERMCDEARLELGLL